jgi:hypothetical protein
MRRSRRSVLPLSLLLVFALPAIAAAAEDLPPLKNGDIVFQNTSSSARDAIMLASGTQYTHVGIVEIDEAGRAEVIEAAGPVRIVSFDDWRRKGRGQHITIKRVKGLSESEAKQAIARAHHYLGLPYDRNFYETRDQIYCSELVHAAFKEGANISVGREQKLRDLNTNTAAARTLIKKRWRTHPLCKATPSPTFETCYELILDQTVVTPASIAGDPKMEIVYTDFAGPE